MPRVFLPRTMHELTGGQGEIEVAAGTVGEMFDRVNEVFPGFRARLCDGDRIRPGLAVTANGRMCTLGLLERLEPDAEVHILPAIGGG